MGAPPPDAPEIDPRIRARRIEVRRDVGRRRLRRLVDLCFVLVVAVAFGTALRSPLLDVDEVRISGAERTGREAVLDASDISTGEQLMDIHPGAVGRRIVALPWVAEVTVHRGLGGVVQIEVVERQAVAISGHGDGAVLVDARGRVLAHVAEAPEAARDLVTMVDLPEGLEPGAFLPPGSHAALEVAMGMGRALPGSITEVVAGEQLTARLAQGGTVRLGDSSRLAAKLRSLQTVLSQVDLTCLATIDIRVPGSPVLTRDERCS